MNKNVIVSYLQPLSPSPTGMQPSGSLKLPVECLLCDIYGTLLISGSGDVGPLGDSILQQEALHELLYKYDLPFSVSQLHEHLRNAIETEHKRAKTAGIDFPEICIDLIWQSVLQWTDPNFVRRFAAEYEMIVNPVWPMPGLKNLLDHCTRRNIRLGIISNAQFFTPLLFEWLLDMSLPALGFDPRLIFFSYKHGLAKPSARLFDLVLRQLKQAGVEARHAAYVGNDMRNDVAAACKAGFQTILFAGDARSLRLRKDDPECLGISPDLVITELIQLESFL